MFFLFFHITTLQNILYNIFFIKGSTIIDFRYCLSKNIFILYSFSYSSSIFWLGAALCDEPDEEELLLPDDEPPDDELPDDEVPEDAVPVDGAVVAELWDEEELPEELDDGVEVAAVLCGL